MGLEDFNPKELLLLKNSFFFRGSLYSSIYFNKVRKKNLFSSFYREGHFYYFSSSYLSQ